MNGGLAGHEHGQTVDTHTETGSWRHAIFKRADEVHVYVHSLVVALALEGRLFFETLQLVYRVVELGVSVGQLLAAHEEFEALGQRRVVAVTLGQRRHLHGVIYDKCGLYELVFTVCAEDGVNKLAFAHGRLHRHVELLASGTQLRFIHALHVHSGVFLDGVENGQTAVTSAEVNLLLADLHQGGAVDLEGNLLQHLLHEAHHPVVVLVGHINLHAGELRIVRLVHAFVAEVLGEFVHTIVAAHNEALEVQLVSYPEVQGDVQRIVMGYEGACGSSSGDALEYGGLHFQAARGVEILTHGGYNLRPLDEHILYLRVHYEVHVALAVAQFGIGESVVNLALGFFDYRKHAQRLAQESELLGVNAQLAGLGYECKPFDADDVANVQELLPHGVVHGLVFTGADLVAFDVDLNASALVLQFAERRCAHDAAAHKPSRYAHFVEIAFFGVVTGGDFSCVGVDRIFCCRIGIYAQFPELRQRFAANLLLFAKFYHHNGAKVRIIFVIFVSYDEGMQVDC